MKKTSKILFIGILFLYSTPSIPSQTHLSVGLGDLVYTLLESAELKGAISRLSTAKPYSRSVIATYLTQTYRDRNSLTVLEKSILERYIASFNMEKKGLGHGNIHYEANNWTVQFGLDYLSDFRINFNRPEGWHMNNVIRFYFRGDLTRYLSYFGMVGFTMDKVGPYAFVPYGFTKNWDGVHLTFDVEKRYSLDGIEPEPYFSFQSEPEITAQFLDHNLIFRMARFRREWGIGDGSLSIAGTARPFEAVEIHARLAPWIGLSHTVGSLGNWVEEKKVKNDSTAPTYQKMMTVQMLELFPLDWLYLSATATAIWGKRFELGYLNPLMYSLHYQYLIGNFDNMTQAISLALTFPHVSRFYFTFFADEMGYTTLEKLFKRPRNMFALQAGLKIPLPILAFTILTFQYTKIEPFTYAHYPENTPFFSNPVDMSYTHDGENLGYHLPPNSDEFLLKLESLPAHNIKAGLQYQLIRHGDNPSSAVGDLTIQGDINKPLNYAELNNYPDKNFLNDGLYDWNHILTMFGFYSFDRIPITFGLKYSFAYTFWKENNSGETAPKDEIRNILAFTVKIFR